jgi:hypothetical protein
MIYSTIQAMLLGPFSLRKHSRTISKVTTIAVKSTLLYQAELYIRAAQGLGMGSSRRDIQGGAQLRQKRKEISASMLSLNRGLDCTDSDSIAVVSVLPCDIEVRKLVYQLLGSARWVQLGYCARDYPWSPQSFRRRHGRLFRPVHQSD